MVVDNLKMVFLVVGLLLFTALVIAFIFRNTIITNESGQNALVFRGHKVELSIFSLLAFLSVFIALEPLLLLSEDYFLAVPSSESLHIWSGDKQYSSARTKCFLLKGDYSFHRDASYIFMNKSDIRATAKKGSWENLRCVQGEIAGTYELIGDDIAEHVIEIKLRNGDYVHIDTVTTSHKSKIYIGHDGKLGVRLIIGDVGVVQREYVYRKDPTLSKYEKDIEDKIREYDQYRRESHENTNEHNACIPAIGEDNLRIVLTFACSEYTETLVRS